MADEILRSKHAFGSIENLDQAIADKKVDAYDILFLTTPTGHTIGWIDKDGNKVILENNVTNQVVVVDELPETGVEGVIYIFENDGYTWNGTEFINMCKAPDITEVVNTANAYTDEQIATIINSMAIVEF